MTIKITMQDEHGTESTQGLLEHLNEWHNQFNDAEHAWSDDHLERVHDADHRDNDHVADMAFNDAYHAHPVEEFA